jgi:hypothetical protein
MVEKWTMSGSLLGDCNCDWGCPCNFDVAPTYGHCEGVYTWAVREGRYGDVSLGGLVFAFAGRSPGPLHEGNTTAVLVIDEAASAAQREAIETLARSGAAGLPWDILNSVTSTWLDTVVTPMEIQLDGMGSRATMGGGSVYEVALSRIRNPVTGDEEELYLDKPTGFTAKRTELGTTSVSRFSCDGLSWDVSGKYGEYSEFEYSGP